MTTNYHIVSRKAFIKINSIKKNFNISAVILFVVAISSYVLAFLTLKPDSSLLTTENTVISPYLVMNLSIFIMVISFLFFIAVNLICWITRKAPPLVEIKDYFIQDTAYLSIRNKEPIDLDYIQIRMLGLSIDSEAKWNAIKDFDHNHIIKIEKRIVSGEKLDIPITVGKNGFTNFEFDDGKYNLALENPESQHSLKRYKIILEIFAHPASEQKSLLVGIYSGIIYHERHNGTKLFDGKRYHDDKLIYQDMVGWEKGSFQRITKKESEHFVLNLGALQP